MPDPEHGQRWGILGGLFDPVHLGHLHLGVAVRRSQGLDRVLFVPSYDHPHRPDEAVATYDDRFAMLELALEPHPTLSVSDIERHTSRPSYTLNTVRALKDMHPGVRFHLIVGADNLVPFTTWFRWEELLDEVVVLAAERPHVTPTDIDERVRRKVMFLKTGLVDISSTAIRAAIRRGDTSDQLALLVPQAVADYIIEHKLYV